jgi:outer membrane protein OmpA-like peptidoglycan-associated protein
METAVTAIMGGVASKADDTGVLGKLLDLVPSTMRDTSWTQAITNMPDRNSTWMSAGSRILGSLFGTKENTVTSAISHESGLPASAASNLLTMAGPLVLGFLGRRARDTGMGMSGLSKQLQSESSTIRTLMPASISEIFWPGATTTAKSPVIAQTVQQEEERVKSASAWPLVALAAAALGLGLIWLLNHAHRPTTQAFVPRPMGTINPTGSASREITPTAKTTCTLPAGMVLTPGSPIGRFMAFVENPERGTADWYTIDHVTFASGSATPQPAANAQVDTVAAILKNCPNLHVTIAGYTDNVGASDSNLRLSRNRANSVIAQLVKKGVAPDRLTAEGYGADFPVADNSTAEGRAENRRIAMRMDQK